MMRWSALSLSIVLFACGGAEKAPVSSAESASARTFAEQVAVGQKLYGAKCARCHGDSGEGGKAPRVVGLDKGALPLDPPSGARMRHGQFKTAADVAGFVVKAMPPPSGDASLTEDDYWAILAFDLHANGVDLPDRLDGKNASGVVLHK